MQNSPKNSHCFLDQTCDCHLQMVSLTFYLLPVSKWKCQALPLNVTNSRFIAPKYLLVGKHYGTSSLFCLLHIFFLSQSLKVHLSCGSS